MQKEGREHTPEPQSKYHRQRDQEICLKILHIAY